MENTFWTAFAASLLAALVTSTGIYVIPGFEKWGHKNTIYFICFVAGVLVNDLIEARTSKQSVAEAIGFRRKDITFGMIVAAC